MKKFIKKNERYIKTFIEAFASYIAVNALATDFNNIDAIKGIIIGAVASAISVILNIKKLETEKVGKGEE